MKKIIIALLTCSLMFVLTACGTAQCKGCGKDVEKNSDNKNPVGSGYVCEECMSELEDSLNTLSEITDSLNVEDE